MAVVLDLLDSRPVGRHSGPLRVGFVNNMPDGAFCETERQFERLLAAGAPAGGVVMERYWMPGVSRGEAVAQVIDQCYEELGTLYLDPPDALIVTGTEPRAANLRREPYWEPLAGLLDWAATSVASIMLSCLAAHAALAAFDGLDRSALPTKRSGVFPQVVRDDGVLSRNVGPVSFPHSRQNDVPTGQLVEHGYHIVAEGPGSGWTIATKQRSRCLFVLLQGHPEYGATSLLREYRRDVRRFLVGERRTYPDIPAGYLDPGGHDLLDRYRADSRGAFPFEEAASHIHHDWSLPAAQLMTNWLRLLEAGRSGQGRTPVLVAS